MAEDETFITGIDHNHQQGTDDMGMSNEELIIHVERQMKEFERNADYIEAEKARQHLVKLKKRQSRMRAGDLARMQQEDVKVFFSMVAQHQDNFDRTWAKQTLEHKLRADDLIDALKWKHDDQQKELYEQLRQKRMPKFSVELLHMRKRQVMLAKARQYVQAENLKRKADLLEAIEIEKIRKEAKQENQIRFKALLRRQHWDRQALAEKLKIEKKCLLEAKAQDFNRLKKRLRNAEAELKKTHIRQVLQNERKLAPLYSTLNFNNPRSKKKYRRPARFQGAATDRTSNRGEFKPQPPPRRSARELAKMGRGR